MHTTLWTLLLVVGAGEAIAADPFMLAGTAQVSNCTSCDDCGSICDEGCGSGCGYGCGILPGWCGPMPQTCYAPRFGCYPGNNRHMHRYPAFHGYYYRTPYNYRHLFDYPWHATPHEPVGFYTYRDTDLPDDRAVNPFQQERAPAEPLMPIPAGP